MDYHPKPAESQAEFLYTRWLLGLEQGAKVPFDELCGLHPGDAEELREWHCTQTRLRALLQAAGLGDLEAERQERRIAGAVRTNLMHFGAPARRYRQGAEISSHCGKTVHAAEDALTGRAVVCTLLQSGSEQRRNLANLRRKLRVSGRLDHPCIASILDAGLDAEGTPYFVTNRLPAHDLWSILRGLRPADGLLALEPVLETLLRSAEAIAYAHARGVVHSKLNPALIHVGDSGQVLVSGWEGAFVHADQKFSDTDDNLGWQPFASVSGAFQTKYLPPEARNPDRPPTPTWDVYSFGVLLREALAMHDSLQESCETANIYQFGLPAEWNNLVQLATKEDPGQRFPDCASLVPRLRSLTRAVGASAPWPLRAKHHT